MCIACHYRGDSRLVSREVRLEAHGDGEYRCIRGDRCADCRDPVEDGVEHLCRRVASQQIEGTRQTAYADALRESWRSALMK